eukprot:758113-Hanusia_phi.AAC.6
MGRGAAGGVARAGPLSHHSGGEGPRNGKWVAKLSDGDISKAAAKLLDQPGTPSQNGESGGSGPAYSERVCVGQKLKWES